MKNSCRQMMSVSSSSLGGGRGREGGREGKEGGRTSEKVDSRVRETEDQP